MNRLRTGHGDDRHGDDGHGDDRHGDDEGRIALLSLGFALVALVLVLLVVSASAVHLQRKRLYAVADAAAADAADAVDEAAYYSGGGLRGGRVPLSDASVRASAQSYLRLTGAGDDLPGVRLGTATGSPAAGTAQVELVAVLRPPFAAFVPAPFADGVEVHALSRSRSVLR